MIDGETSESGIDSGWVYTLGSHTKCIDNHHANFLKVHHKIFIHSTHQQVSTLIRKKQVDMHRVISVCCALKKSHIASMSMVFVTVCRFRGTANLFIANRLAQPLY